MYRLEENEKCKKTEGETLEVLKFCHNTITHFV